MTTIEVFAPAKINLALHVTDRRADGYHLLDSLVAFADVGDVVRLGLNDRAGFAVAGPESDGLDANADNLVVRALRHVAGSGFAPSVLLKKELPVSSGIGGGSSDAAAAIRAAAHARDASLEQMFDEAAIERLAHELGADLPMCLEPRPWRVTGIGERLAPVELPRLHAVLVNPRIAVSTPEVFKRLESPHNGPMGWPETASVEGFVKWLAGARNDLEAPARLVAPEIGQVLARLRKMPDTLIARMSGSGATCFALFQHQDAASKAAQNLAATEPAWWIRAVTLGDMSEMARPRISAVKS